MGKRWAAMVLAMLIALLAVAYSPLAWTRPIDLEAAKRLALEAAETHPDIRFEPYDVTEAKLERPEFDDHYFLVVWAPEYHGNGSNFAVSPDGAVFKLPQEFSQLALDKGLTVAGPEEVQSLLQFYLELSTIGPSDKHIILAEITDIPGVEEGDPTDEIWQAVVKPMQISSSEEEWTFDFFTWRIVGGGLFSWEVKVSEAGEINVEQMELFDLGLGNAITIK